MEIGIRTPVVENQNINEEDAETENEEYEEYAETDIIEDTPAIATLETSGATAEHDVPQATENNEETQPIKQKNADEAQPEQEDINEALPENEVLPDNKYDREEIKYEDETPNEVSHPSTLTPSTQAVYRMDRLRKNRKRDYSYRFASVMHHEMTQMSLKRGLKQFKEKGENAV